MIKSIDLGDGYYFKVGDNVKISTGKERFWNTVEKLNKKTLIVRVANDLCTMPDMYGKLIKIKYTDIVDVWRKGDAMSVFNKHNPT